MEYGGIREASAKYIIRALGARPAGITYFRIRSPGDYRSHHAKLEQASFLLRRGRQPTALQHRHSRTVYELIRRVTFVHLVARFRKHHIYSYASLYSVSALLKTFYFTAEIKAPPAPSRQYAMSFGDFQTICHKSALPLCSLVGSSPITNKTGIQATCYARSVELANTIIFEAATDFMHILALGMAAIMILHVRSKFTAVGTYLLHGPV